MKKIVTILSILIICSGLGAQDTLYIHKKDATISKIQLKNTDSLKISSGKLEYTASEIELNKQNFRKWNPTDIPYQEYSGMFGIDKIWNNKWGAAAGSNDCYATRSGGNSTSSITFDLNGYADNSTGKGWVIPTRMKIYARSTYNYTAIGKNIRVWGSTSPTVSTANTTGPDAWVLLSPEEGFLLAPPSGQSGLTPTVLDKKYIEEDGYELFFKADVPPIRYMRLEMVSRWNTTIALSSFTIGEVTLWGKEKKQYDTLCVVKNKIESIKIPISNIDSVKFEGPLSPDYVYDIDMNPYRTVKIGTQTWMVDNLKTTRFRNGEVIPNVTSSTAWAALTSGARCYYANDSINSEKYGYLYNWKAVNDNRKIAPAGWHVATADDWSTLISYLGESDAATKLKDKGWLPGQSSNLGTNETGFTALQGGSRSSDGTFSNEGVAGNWWCFNYDINTGKPWWILINDSKTVSKLTNESTFGFSVRCVRNELPQISTEKISESGNNIVIGGNITNTGGDAITESGVCWSTNPNPTINNNRTITYSGGRFSSSIIAPLHLTTYYLRAYATNSVGTSYGEVVSFTTPDNRVYDIDGNTYHAITIGTQTWMAEDLKTTRYRNGNLIENASDNILWNELTTSAISTYSGYFYNWYAVNDSRKIAPEGWHIPSDAEWATLTNYLGGASVAGGKLKMSDFQYWIKPNSGATNETGFSAIANGMKDNSCVAKLLGNNAFWWSSSEFNTTNAVYRGISNTSSSISEVIY